MNLSQLYFNLGIQHILDFVAFDHILFLLVLGAPYAFKNYKKVIGLATLFTVGHSLTLVFATLGYLQIPMTWIEFLIPCTILITALSNLLDRKETGNKIQFFVYLSTLFFGLIHGLGFSTYLKSLLTSETDLLQPLLYFNLGIEIGQLIVLTILLIVNYIICRFSLKKQMVWSFLLSSVSALIAIALMIQRFP